MRLSQHDPLVLFWDGREGAGFRESLTRKYIEQLKTDSRDLRYIEFEELKIDDRLSAPRSIIRQLSTICEQNPRRPICFVCSLDWNRLTGGNFFDASAFGRSRVERASDRDATAELFAGFGGQLVLRFPEVWMVFADFAKKDEAARFITQQLLEPAASASSADLPADNEKQIAALNAAVANTLRITAMATLQACHIAYYRKSDVDSKRLHPNDPIESFLRHRQVIFDPSGLRSIVKAQLWNRKSSQSSQLNLPSPARILLERVVNNSLIADEEFETAQAVAYSLYRLGRRCWSIVDGSDFLFGPWRTDRLQEQDLPCTTTSLLVRDLQLQLYTFELDRIVFSPEFDRQRLPVLLENIDHWDSEKWIVPTAIRQENGAIKPIKRSWLSDNTRRVVITAHEYADPSSDPASAATAGLIEKPVDSLFFTLKCDQALTVPLQPTMGAGCVTVDGWPASSHSDTATTLVQRLTWQIRNSAPQTPEPPPVGDSPPANSERSYRKSDHSTQPVFYQLATALMARAESLEQATIEDAMIAGVFYQEAFELLAGLNFPTSIKAYSQLQSIEARIEATAYGTFSAKIDLSERKEEIESVLLDTFGACTAFDRLSYKRTHDHGLQIWSTISGTYRNCNATNPANDAQVESLVYIGGDARTTKLRSWAAEFPVKLLHILIVAFSGAPWRTLPRAVRSLSTRWRSPRERPERRLQRFLRAKRETFELLARPWVFLVMYFKFLVTWVGYTMSYRIVFEKGAINGTPKADLSTFLEITATSLSHVLSAAISSELWQGLDSAHWAHQIAEYSFLIANFGFLTILLAVLVKFILRD